MSHFDIELCLWEIERSLNQMQQAEEMLSEHFSELLEINKKIEELLEMMHG